jgi:hypothetical protein
MLRRHDGRVKIGPLAGYEFTLRPKDEVVLLKHALVMPSLCIHRIEVIEPHIIRTDGGLVQQLPSDEFCDGILLPYHCLLALEFFWELDIQISSALPAAELICSMTDSSRFMEVFHSPSSNREDVHEFLLQLMNEE